MKQIPQQYKHKIDALVLSIVDNVNSMMFFVRELGAEIEINNDKYCILIKRKGKHENNK